MDDRLSYMEMPLVRLWTFQQRRVTSFVWQNGRYRPSWRFVHQTERIPYEWMANQMHEYTGITTKEPPVWCWHSCGQLGAPPTVETALMLLSEAQMQEDLVTIELLVPERFVLLSSYSAWNDFLDAAANEPGLPKNIANFRRLFDVDSSPESDSLIQAVIPYIVRNWIVDVRKLAVHGRRYSDAV